MFSSGQPTSGTEDSILQSENLRSNAPISQQTQASISAFFHEEVTSVLGQSESQPFNSSSTLLNPDNLFGQQVNKNDGQANIPDATMGEDVEETIVSDGARLHEEENMGEPSSQDPRSWIWTRFSVIAMPGKMWAPKGSSKPRENREICCAWPNCSFSTTDEKRQGSTSDMLQHLHTVHRITKMRSFFCGKAYAGYYRCQKPYSVN
ncbi:hypothetical protein [uncultured Nostoc sp.]|uniref:hypothetical protein n=1 Tax=uncultured Nostoc sp. TaxID=340711 RepID=UPI0035CB68AD